MTESIQLATRNSGAVVEMIQCLKAWKTWVFLSFNDVRMKYRRTFLGPWWVVLGMGISLGLMSVLWSLIFGLDWRVYLNYMMAGIITWYWVQAYITQSCDVFTMEFCFLIRSLPTPPIIYIYRFVLRGAWLYLHYLPIWLISAIVTGSWPSLWVFILFPLAFVVILLNATAVSVLLGMGNARFRDLSPAVQALMTPMMLLTPIIWHPSMLGEYQIIAALNPFTHFIAIIREPLIGNIPTVFNWVYVAAVTTINLCAASLLYSKYRRYIVFWI